MHIGGNHRPFPDTGLPWDTIPAMLADVLALRADSAALIDGDVAFDYRGLGEQSAAVAANLTRLGVTSGDPVVIWSHNCWQWVVSALGCWMAGAVVVPLSARLKPLEVLPVLRATAAKVLLTSTASHRIDLPRALIEYCDEHGDGIAAELPHLSVIGVFEGGDVGEHPVTLTPWSMLTDAPGEAVAAEVGADDLCEIMFTSGSTGKPKGVMLGQRQTLQIMWDARACWTIDPTDRVLVIAPLSHVTGINAGLLAALMAGSTLVLMDVFHPGRALALIAAQQVSCIAGPPAMFKQLLVENRGGDSLDSLRKISILGAPVPAALVEEIRAESPIEAVFTGYGMTECSSIATTRAADPLEVVRTTVGEPMPGLEVRVFDDNGNDVSGRMAGEIRVRGYGVMRGYLDDEAQTRATVTDDDWLCTGDIGEITADGRVRLLGREKEMYIAYGFNVFPKEIEFLLLESGLLESAAVVARPNRFSGEEGIAFVVPKAGTAVESSALMTWAKRNMANYKVPSRFFLRDALPLNANGKVDKLALAAEITKG